MRRTLVLGEPMATQSRRSRVRQLGQTLRALAGMSSILLTGCLGYPDADERFDDTIIYTRYDKEKEQEGVFAEYKTFAIDPEVKVFEEDDGEIETDTLPDDLADQLIERTVDNLEARGYTKVDKADAPDLGVNLSLVKGKVTGYYGGYWGSYWGYWGYYYPYYVSYSYDTNTLLTDAVDLKGAPPVVNPDPGDTPDPDDKVTVLWTGMVYGVAQDTLAENLDNALHGIDQAFKQSPYFQTLKGGE